MKLLLSCALSASLHGAAAEVPLGGARARRLPSLGPNFDAAVDQVLRPVHPVQYVASRTTSVSAAIQWSLFFSKQRHDCPGSTDGLSFSKELDRNATRECQVMCDGSHPRRLQLIEPCKRRLEYATETRTADGRPRTGRFS